MSVLSKSDFMARIKSVIGEDTSDEALALIEDATDTLDDYETRVSPDGTDWKAESERIDREWRAKYKERFFSSDPKQSETDEPENETPKKLTFENLFKEG